jgi:hypothetical protein
MGSNRLTVRKLAAVTTVIGVSLAGSSMARAAQPEVTTDDGAFVRVLGNPTDGTLMFQFGWMSSTVASDAAGYWVGVYDVTNGKYVWNSDTGPVDLPEQLKRNARPTADLPQGEYKVVFFVRETYAQPVMNLAEIEVPFVVDNEDMMDSGSGATRRP